MLVQAYDLDHTTSALLGEKWGLERFLLWAIDFRPLFPFG